METELLLSSFMPKSELRLAIHEVSQPRFPVFDVHTHFGFCYGGESFEQAYDTGTQVRLLREQGICRIVNLDGMYGAMLDRMLRKTEGYEDFFHTFGSVDVRRLDEPDFEAQTTRSLHEMKRLGIRGLKFFKDVSLVYRDSAGKFIPIDDRRLQVIWQTAAELGLPVLIHIGDPPAFFKPIDATNERYEELSAHPDWSFFGGGHFPFEALMQMQENLIASNPQTTFIVAHGGSWSENLAWVGQCLDRYPNMNVDISARISEFGRQPYTSRSFFEKYQDRVLFGSDGGFDNRGYPHYYRFLETLDEYFPYSNAGVPKQGRWNIYGVGLEAVVLEKIYHKNADRLILGICE